MPKGPSEQPQPCPTLLLSPGAPKTLTFGGEMQKCGEQVTLLLADADGAASLHVRSAPALPVPEGPPIKAPTPTKTAPQPHVRLQAVPRSPHLSPWGCHLVMSLVDWGGAL